LSCIQLGYMNPIVVFCGYMPKMTSSFAQGALKNLQVLNGLINLCQLGNRTYYLFPNHSIAKLRERIQFIERRFLSLSFAILCFPKCLLSNHSRNKYIYIYGFNNDLNMLYPCGGIVKPIFIHTFRGKPATCIQCCRWYMCCAFNIKSIRQAAS